MDELLYLKYKDSFNVYLIFFLGIIIIKLDRYLLINILFYFDIIGFYRFKL